MNKKYSFVGAAVLVLLNSGAALADPKPQGAKPADPNTVAQLYGGKTQIWKGCQGGIYFGSGWEASAWCKKHSDNVGVGTWKVDGKARVCRDLTWYWPEGDSRGSKPDNLGCIEHVVAPDGTIWRSWPDENEWWSMSGDDSLVKGDKFKSKKRKNSKKLGL